MARVFLTGGGGYIGGQLAAALLERGEQVIGLARTDASARALADLGAQVVRGDVLQAQALSGAMAGCDVVYHVAGLNSHCPKDPQQLMRVNVRGPENVVRAAGRAGIERVVLTSSAASVGEVHGTVGTEQSRHRGSYLSAYDRSKHEGERTAFAAAAETGVQVVALNPSSVQGPPRRSGTGAIMIAFLNGRLPAFVDVPVSMVDIQDVVRGHLLAAERGRAGGRYILNGATIASTEALRLVAQLSQTKGRVRLVRPGLARGAARGSEWALGLVGRTSPLCRGRVQTILHGHRYDGSLATRELGLTYTPLAETLARTIEWARAEGLVERGG